MSLINKIFNIVYVSSYSDSPRLKNLNIHLQKLNINYKIIYGVKYDSINLNKELKDNKISANFCDKFQNKNGLKRLIANYQTHNLIYEDFLKTKYNECMIIEDDCFFIDEYEKYINLKYIPKNYDYIQYGWENYVFCQANAKDTHYNFFYDKIYWGRSGVHCYVITRNAVKKILKNIYPQYKAIDGFLGDLVYINKKNYPKDIKPVDKKDKLHNCYISKKKIAFGLSQGTNSIYKSSFQESIS